MMEGPVTCAGYVIGAGPAMLDYFRTFMDIFMNNASASCWWRRSEGADSGDQVCYWAVPATISDIQSSLAWSACSGSLAR
jgi:hypothetical protein